MVLIETPLVDLTYRFAGTPDRVYGQSAIAVVPGIQFEEDGHIYMLNGVVYPSITQILKKNGIIDFSHVDETVLKMAAEFGKAVHAACHYDDIGDLDEDALSKPIRPYLDAWREAREKYQNEEAVVEIKTSTAVEEWVGLQLAAQCILSSRPTSRRIAVQLKSDGKFKPYEFKKRTDRGVFLAALSVYQWRMEYGTTSN